MPHFGEALLQSTARGANLVPGCVIAAVDRTGQYAVSAKGTWSFKEQD
jgi:hypothetical protein